MTIQEIGIVIDLDVGTFNNTVYKNDRLQLAERGVDGDGNIVYVDTGYWESEPIAINDRIASFKNVATTVSTVGGATYKMYVKTSPDGFVWDNYIEVDPTGTIKNTPDRWAKIKIEIFSEKGLSNFYVDNFYEVGKYNNYLNTENGALSLKKKYNYKMTKTQESNSGSLHVQTILRSKFKKIDKIRVNRG